MIYKDAVTMDQIRKNRKAAKTSQDVKVHSVEEVGGDDNHSMKSVCKLEFNESRETVSVGLEEMKLFSFTESVVLENIGKVHLGEKQSDPSISFVRCNESLSESESECSMNNSENTNKVGLKSVSVTLDDESLQGEEQIIGRQQIKHTLVDDESVISMNLDDEKGSNGKEVGVGVLKQMKNNAICCVNKISCESMDTIAKISGFLFIFWIVWNIFSISAHYTKKVTSKRYTNM